MSQITTQKTKNGKCVNTIHISDVHLGNKRVSVKHMVMGLLSTINKNRLKQADLLIIGGDLWDKALSVAVDNVPDIVYWINLLLKECSQLNVKLRVLEGTPSHDRKQSRLILTLNSSLNAPADVKYYDKLCIDYEEDYNMNILYVPDEWKHSTEKAWQDVLLELKRHALDKVDMAIMHGMFEYQMPSGIKLPCHSEERYLGVVSRFISIGHVHTKSIYKRIFAQGSHDRISHNEEEPKGLIVSEIYEDMALDKLTFIENKLAMPFISINVEGMDEKDASKKIDTVVLNRLETSDYDCYLRVVASDNEIIKRLYKNFTESYTRFQWKLKVVKEKTKKPKEERKRKLRTISNIGPSSLEGFISKLLSDADICSKGPSKELAGIMETIDG